MSAERIYCLLLRAYPRRFRSEYGREMTLIFREEFRGRDTAALGFWITIVLDVARSAPPMWMDALRTRMNDYTRIVEVIMKLTGLVAILLGAYGVVNAFAEAVPGMRGTPGGAYIVAVVLAIIGAALLLTAGAAMLRNPVSGRHTASVATLASLVTVAIARLLHPWMSTFALIVGIALPIVLLAALQWTNRRDGSTSRAQ